MSEGGKTALCNSRMVLEHLFLEELILLKERILTLLLMLKGIY